MKSCALVLNNDFVLYICLCQILSSSNQAASIVLISGIQLSLDCLMTRERVHHEDQVFSFFSSSFQVFLINVFNLEENVCDYHGLQQQLSY